MPKTTTKPASKPKKTSTTEAAPKRRKRLPTFANYHAALAYLTERVDLEKIHGGRIDPKTFKPERMAKLMEGLGNPQDALRCVHVGGTNGKGSVVTMLSSCLRECGFTVGTYTSPHLVDIRERIAIDGQMISHHFFTELMPRVARAAEEVPERLGPPTFFELVTALALLHFAEQAVDIAVIEVGLGGKLDATNIIKPEVAAVTQISYDHMQLLGKTLPEIAEQKAGIFKKNTPALTVQQEPGVVDAMRAIATAVGAPLQVVGQDIEFSTRLGSSDHLGKHYAIGLSTDRVVFEHVPVPLPGEHQALNCGLVLAILERLMERGYELPQQKIAEGLKKTHIPGRMELAWKEPSVLLDGAHNPAAISALVKSIGAHVAKSDSMIVIFGCAADKDIDEMLKQLSLGADKVIFTRASNTPRAADPKELGRRFMESTGKMAQVAATLEEALSIAGRGVSREDLILITGSFYLVGEAKKLLDDRRAKKAEEAERVAIHPAKR